MMTKLTGLLTRVLDEEARVSIGPFEYQVLISEATRRQLMFRIDQETSLYIAEYLEGNQSGTRFVPRKIGFLSEVELEFFDLFCTVDKIGVKKALKAMSRSVRDIAEAINRQDVKWLTTLPGIGATTAEQMISTLRKKMPPFLTARAEATTDGTSNEAEPLSPAHTTATKRKPRPHGNEAATPPAPPPSAALIDDLYEALMAMGLTPVEARDRIDRLLRSGKPFSNHAEAIHLLFSTKG